MNKKNTNYISINWLDIIIKILIVILFIALLLILIPIPNIDHLNNRIYNENIEIMRNAARNYYTNDNLPTKVGESVKMTLKEMEEEKLIIPFIDKEGKTCDNEASYVEVTKISKDEYALKVQLNCQDEKDYILDTIGCYDICDDNCNNEEECEKVEVISYEYKRESTTTTKTYTCPIGYTKSDDKCYKKTEEEIINATPQYTKDNISTVDAIIENDSSTIVYAKPIKAAVDKSITCPSGYHLNGDYCYKYTNGVIENNNYVCPNNYQLYGSTCYKVEAADIDINTYCPSGYTLTYDQSQCYKETGQLISNQVQSCPAGYAPSGGNCVKSYSATTSSSGWVLKSTNTYTYLLSEYYTSTEKRELINSEYVKTCTTCYTYQWHYTYATYTKSSSTSCPSGGSYNNGTCYLSTNYITTEGAKYCSSGTLVNGRCLSYTAANIDISYSCKNSYGELISDKCYDELEIDYTYTCPDNYYKLGTGDNTNCYRITKGEMKLTCPDSSYTLEGTSCVKKTEEKLIGYTCPAGYSLINNNQCIKYTNQTINAEVNEKNETTWKYVWSRNENLEGWIKTDKTKIDYKTECN